MSLSDLEYLRHILDETDFIINKAGNIKESDFYRDEVMKRAVVRSLEIIGEAAKKLSGELRIKYIQIEWKSIIGMRDRLIHGYFGVDYELVWDVIANKIPLLRHEIEKVISAETRE